MGFRNLAKILVIGILISLIYTNVVWAGFGISPPEVWNNHLRPGSHFEQIIYLVQSKPLANLKGEVEIDAPEIKGWISFENGEEFVIPAGVQQYPLKVLVDVPQDAEFKTYRGKIWVRTSPIQEQGKEGSTVGIALGSIIDINLTVSAEEVRGFLFRGATIKDAERGRPIEVILKIQNTGNVEENLTKVTLDVYDAYLKDIIQTEEITKIEKIKPFETKEFALKFPNKLDVGTYFGRVQAFKDEYTVSDVKQPFKILERTGFLSKIFKKWYAKPLLILIIIIILVLIFRNKLKKWLRSWRIRKLERERLKVEKKLRRLGKH